MKTLMFLLLSVTMSFASVTMSFAQDSTFTEIQKFLASDAQADDLFGNSVSISGDYVIVGAYAEDEGGSNAGAAYIYHRDQNGNWSEVTKLLASDAELWDSFGRSVSISGDYAIVGAPNEDEGGGAAGAAYIYHRDQNGNWLEVTKLLASDAQSDDYFGWSVSISGDYAIVGAYAEEEGGLAAGAAYIYHRDQNGNWLEVTKLIASDAQDFDQYGISVSISGDYAIVGAYLEDEGGLSAGAAYIYHRDQNGNWLEIQKLVASDAQADDQFGNSVSISGDFAIVGAYLEDEGGLSAGATYIYNRDQNGNWLEVTKLLASDAQADDQFGWSVSISGEFAIVGALDEEEGGSDAGAAYIYHRDQNGNWLEFTKLLASDVQADDEFGNSVSISGDYVIVGASHEDEGGSDAGAAYLFEKAIDTTGIIEIAETIPLEYSLAQNYPNPFNMSTMIKYSLPMNSEVTIELYDILGRKIETLVNEVQPAGYYKATWDANDVSSGIYFYKIQAGEYREVKKMSLLK